MFRTTPKLGAPSTVCEVVDTPADADAFPGLFIGVLPLHCWLELGAAERGGEVDSGSGSECASGSAVEKTVASPPQLAIAMSTQWGSDLAAIVLPLRASDEEGRHWAASAPTRLSAPQSGSDRVLAVSARCGAIVVESSTPISPSTLAMYTGQDVARAVAAAADGTGCCATAAPCRHCAREFGESKAQPARLAGEGLWWRTLRIPVPPSAGDASAAAAAASASTGAPTFIEVIACGPGPGPRTSRSDGAAVPRPHLPTVVYPHGGPHAAWSTTFHRRSAFLALSGYLVLKVNYRGSTGFGGAALASLLGRVGEQDVGDVLLVLDALLASNSGARSDNAPGSASASNALDLNCVLPAERVAYVGGR